MNRKQDSDQRKASCSLLAALLCLCFRSAPLLFAPLLLSLSLSLSRSSLPLSLTAAAAAVSLHRIASRHRCSALLLIVPSAQHLSLPLSLLLTRLLFAVAAKTERCCPLRIPSRPCSPCWSLCMRRALCRPSSRQTARGVRSDDGGSGAAERRRTAGRTRTGLRGCSRRWQRRQPRSGRWSSWTWRPQPVRRRGGQRLQRPRRRIPPSSHAPLCCSGLLSPSVLAAVVHSAELCELRMAGLQADHSEKQRRVTADRSQQQQQRAASHHALAVRPSLPVCVRVSAVLQPRPVRLPAAAGRSRADRGGAGHCC